MLTELLHRAATGPHTETPRFLAMIQQCCDEANALLQDLLYLGELDATQLKKEPTNLNAFLDAQLSMHRLVAQEKGITLTLEMPAHIVTTQLNANKLSRVVVNLLTNALKFTPAGGRVTVRLSEHAGQPRLSVQDISVGIASEL